MKAGDVERVVSDALREKALQQTRILPPSLKHGEKVGARFLDADDGTP